MSGWELARTLDKWKGRTPRTSNRVRDHFDDAMKDLVPRSAELTANE